MNTRNEMFRCLTKMRNINLIWDSERVCCTKFLELWLSSRVIFITKIILFFTIVMTTRWGNIVHTFRSAILGCQHVDLSKMGNFNYNCIIIFWQWLLPRLPIDPHKCMVSSTFVKLKADSVCLFSMTNTNQALPNHCIRNWTPKEINTNKKKRIMIFLPSQLLKKINFLFKFSLFLFFELAYLSKSSKMNKKVNIYELY